MSVNEIIQIFLVLAGLLVVGGLAVCAIINHIRSIL